MRYRLPELLSTRHPRLAGGMDDPGNAPSRRPRGPGGQERGSVMVLTLLVTLVILAIGLTAMWLSSSGARMSGNITRRQEALYTAEAGLEHSMAILKNTTDWSTLLVGCTSGYPNDPGLGKKGMVLCESGQALRDVQLTKGGTSTIAKIPGLDELRYTVFVRNDDAEAQDPIVGPNSDADQRVVVRSEATGRDGLSFFAAEVLVSRGIKTQAVDNYSQLGGSAQNLNSAITMVPISTTSSSP